MAAKTEEHHTAVEVPDSPVRVPAGHQTVEKRKEREEQEEEAASERGEEEKEIGSKKRRTTTTKCQLVLEKELGIGYGFSFSFDARCVEPIETTPKFGSFNSSSDLVDLGLGPTTEEEEKSEGGVAEEGTGGGARGNNREGTDGI